MRSYCVVPFSAETSYGSGPDINEISQWRRELIVRLRALDGKSTAHQPETLAATIQRLTYERMIPRPIASMMRTITATRNEMEYESRQISPAEGVAVRACCDAVNQWFDALTN